MAAALKAVVDTRRFPNPQKKGNHLHGPALPKMGERYRLEGPRDNTRESVRTNLVHWMNILNRPQLQATELLRHLGLLVDSSSPLVTHSRECGVYEVGREGSLFDGGSFCRLTPCPGEATCAKHRDMPGLDPQQGCHPPMGDLAGSSWTLPYFPNWRDDKIPGKVPIPFVQREEDATPDTAYGREFLGADYFGIDVTYVIANGRSVQLPAEGTRLGLFVRSFDGRVIPFLQQWLDTLQVYSVWYLELNDIDLNDAPVLCAGRHTKKGWLVMVCTSGHSAAGGHCRILGVPHWPFAPLHVLG